MQMLMDPIPNRKVLAVFLAGILVSSISAQTPQSLAGGLPQEGYILYNQPDGIYRHTFPGRATRKLVDKGKAQKINPANGNRIVYVARKQQLSRGVISIKAIIENSDFNVFAALSFPAVLSFLLSLLEYGDKNHGAASAER